MSLVDTQSFQTELPLSETTSLAGNPRPCVDYNQDCCCLNKIIIQNKILVELVLLWVGGLANKSLGLKNKLFGLASPCC